MADKRRICCCWPSGGKLGIYNNHTDHINVESQYSISGSSETWIADACNEIQAWNPTTFTCSEFTQEIENTMHGNPFKATFAAGSGQDTLEQYDAIIIPRLMDAWGGLPVPDPSPLPYTGIWPCEWQALNTWLGGGPDGTHSGRRLVVNSDYMNEVHIGNLAQIYELGWEQELIRALGGATQIGSSLEHVSVDAWAADCDPVGSDALGLAFMPPVLNFLVAGVTQFHDSQPALVLNGIFPRLWPPYVWPTTCPFLPVAFCREMQDYGYWAPWITFQPVGRGYLICILDWYFWDGFGWGEATCNPPIDHAWFVWAIGHNDWGAYGGA